MDVADELLASNRLYADTLVDQHVDLRPARALAIVTCMDSRLNVFAALGLEEGDAHVLRNAGGVITDDMIRSLAISQRLLGTRDVMLIHHTDCGMQRLTDDGFRAELPGGHTARLRHSRLNPSATSTLPCASPSSVFSGLCSCRIEIACAASSTTSTRTGCGK